MKDMTVIVTISSDGTRTVAEATAFPASWPLDAAVDGSLSGVGSSARERGDKGNQQVGDDLAVARALESLAAHMKRRANGNVKHAEDIKAHRREIAERNASLTAAQLTFDNAFRAPHDF